MPSRDVFCRDDSHLCMKISPNNTSQDLSDGYNCLMPIIAKLCKISCGLCNNNQLPGLPQSPLQGIIFYKFEVSKYVKIG